VSLQPHDLQEKFFAQVVKLAAKDAKTQNKLDITPELFVKAYRQVAGDNSDIRFGSFRDAHWHFLRKLVPSFRLEDGGKLDKLKNAVIKLHPLRDGGPDFSDDVEEVKHTASNLQVLKRIRELEQKDLVKHAEMASPIASDEEAEIEPNAEEPNVGEPTIGMEDEPETIVGGYEGDESEDNAEMEPQEMYSRQELGV